MALLIGNDVSIMDSLAMWLGVLLAGWLAVTFGHDAALVHEAFASFQSFVRVNQVAPGALSSVAHGLGQMWVSAHNALTGTLTHAVTSASS